MKTRWLPTVCILGEVGAFELERERRIQDFRSAAQAWDEAVHPAAQGARKLGFDFEICGGVLEVRPRFEFARYRLDQPIGSLGRCLDDRFFPRHIRAHFVEGLGSGRELLDHLHHVETKRALDHHRTSRRLPVRKPRCRSQVR